MAMLDALIALASVAVFFAGGWLFLSRNLFQNYEEKDWQVQVGCLICCAAWYGFAFIRETNTDVTPASCACIELVHAGTCRCCGLLCLHSHATSSCWLCMRL